MQKSKGTGIDIHALIGKLPRPKGGWTLPNHKYTGPFNPLDKQLDENDQPLPGQEPYNQVDSIAMQHDICYRDHEDDKHGCDRVMITNLDKMKPTKIRERLDRLLVKGLIGTKLKLGLGKWNDQLADELHKQIRKTYKRRRVIVNGIDEIWSADLVEMQEFAKQNNSYRYLLTVIDLFSKYAWSIPLKDKTGKATEEAFRKIVNESGRMPNKLWVDDGKEFYNKNVDKWLKENNIDRYSTFNEGKAMVIERFNRTLKTNMWKYFSANNTHRYIDALDELMRKYNSTKHSSILMTPVQASMKKNELLVSKNLYKNYEQSCNKPKFKVGDKVRISKYKRHFEKGYTPNWTEEIFEIVSIRNTNPISYTVKDTNNEIVKGSFYEPELQLTKQKVFRIEKVIKKDNKRAFVKWYGYPSSFNSWVPLSDLTKL